MSAYVVAATTIDEIIYFATECGIVDECDADKAGQMLWKENVKSVNYRYARRDKCEVYEYQVENTMRTLYAVSRCVTTLDYQSCEHAAWGTSKAKQLLNKVMTEVKRQSDIINECVSHYNFT